MEPVVLVIDDNKEDANSVKKILESELGITCHHSEKGSEGLLYLKDSNSIKLVILDLELPDITPSNLIEKIYEINTDIKIIVHTAYPTLLSSDEAEKYRISDYTPKPLIEESFLFASKKLLHKLLSKTECIKIDDLSLLESLCTDNEILINEKDITYKNITAITEKIYSEFSNKMHDDKDVYNRILKNTIISSIDIDALLHLTEKRYRDHCKHQLRVGLLGSFFLNTIYNTDNEKLISHFRNSGSTKGMNNDEIFIAWWTAALLHDYAYPISFLLKSADQLRVVKKKYKRQQDNISDAYTNYLNMYSDYFSGELIQEYIKSCDSENKDSIRIKIENGLSLIFDSSNPYENTLKSNLLLDHDAIYDHGVLTAVIISTKIARSNISKPIKQALKAIALHNNHNNKLSFDKEPLASLLVLSDEMQEWGREMIVDGKTFIENDNICLIIKSSLMKNRIFPDKITFKLQYTKQDILKQTSWDYYLFIKNKELNLSRIENCKLFKSSQIELQTLVPHIIQMS